MSSSRQIVQRILLNQQHDLDDDSDHIRRKKRKMTTIADRVSTTNSADFNPFTDGGRTSHTPSDIRSGMDDYSDYSAGLAYLGRSHKIVPIEQREKFRMIFKSRMGGEDHRKITNSDMIFFDHYVYQLRDELYTQYV